MKTKNSRLHREKNTIGAMIKIYCKGNHKVKDGLCGDCRELLHYAAKRIEGCKFGEKKPVCARCGVHCYKKEMRAQIVRVMRYSGPRMLVKHPFLTIRHVMDSIIKTKKRGGLS